MEWVWLSLLSAAVCSAAIIVQKHCFTHCVRSTLSYGAWAAVVQACLALLLLYFEPLGQMRLNLPVVVALLAGAVRALSLIVQYKGLQAEREVSRAVPIIDSYPIFVAVLAVVFLGQSLTPVKWLAIALVVAGAILISQHNLLPGPGVRLGKPLFYLLSGSLGIAVFVILAKLALGELSFWHVYIFSSLGGAPVFIAAGLASGAGTERFSLFRRPQALSSIIVGEFLLAVSIICRLVAFSIGPVSLVSAITAARPLMVLLYSTFLTVLVPRFLSEELCPQALRQKLVATTMVVAGIATISLVG